MEKETDIESGRGPSSIPHWKMILDQGVITPEILNWPYGGNGTEEEPYAVEWIENDPRNPILFPGAAKWTYALTMAFATLAVSFVSSVFSGGIREIMIQWHASQEVATLGLSLFVLGFAIGPLLWAPLSELYGRQILYTISFGGFTAFCAGSAGSQNIWTLIILRFFAGCFGSSPLTNAGGVIADMFTAKERGLATGIFATAPFMGPVLGPIIGGFLGETEGWRWIGGLTAIFSGIMWILATLLVPETYAPVLLRKRAKKLSKITGKVYKSKVDIDRGEVKASEAFRTALSRPWILLFVEPIVLLLSVYMAIIYGTLYMLFGAYPYVYELKRGWSAGIAGLAFIAVAIGMLVALAYTIFYDQPRYLRAVSKHGGFAPPEERLVPCIVGAISLPVGLFWFAWTNSSSLPWAASMAAGIPFGFGMVLIFLSLLNYLVDAYTIFAASVLAANSVLRSVFGAAFPLFTQQMYDGLGIHWASSIPAFLALACLPFPLLFYKYGAFIRLKCKYATQADDFTKSLRGQYSTQEVELSSPSLSPSEAQEVVAEELDIDDEKSEDRELEDPELDEDSLETGHAGFSQIKTSQSTRSGRSASRTSHEYDENPYNIDRVNTKESFRSESRHSTREGRKLSFGTRRSH